MTLKFVIILQNLIKAYHRKSGKSKYDRKLTELDVETTRIQSRVNGVSKYWFKAKKREIYPHRWKEGIKISTKIGVGSGCAMLFLCIKWGEGKLFYPLLL